LDAIDPDRWSEATAADVERTAQTTDLLIVAHLVLDVLFHLDCPADGDAFIVYATSISGDSLDEPGRYRTLSGAVAAVESRLTTVWDMNLALRAPFKHWR